MPIVYRNKKTMSVLDRIGVLDRIVSCDASYGRQRDVVFLQCQARVGSPETLLDGSFAKV